MLKLNTKIVALLCGALVASAAAVRAQDSGPLVDLLVKKGIVSDQEAEDLRAELGKDFAASSAGKINLSAPLTELRIAGDVRVRYESRTGVLQTTDDNQERDRFRYRLRAGLYGKLLNDWSFGFRLETSTGSRSSNVTMGDDNGPWAKTSDTLNVGQIYIGYTPNSHWNFTLGRMPNPLVTSLLVWDGDINPEGVAEQYRTRIGKAEYFGTATQFLYASGNPQNVFNGAAGSNVKDLYLFAYQGGVKYYTGEGTTDFFQIAPVFYQYYHTSQTANPSGFKGVFSPTNATAINNLSVFEIPVEYDWAAGGVPMRAWAEWAINADARQRARKFFNTTNLAGKKIEDQAYTIGFQYGKAVNPGEWDARVAYQSVGAFALDANLVDSDLFDSRVNMKGWYIGGNYALGAATQFSLTLANGQRVDDSIVAPGAGDIGSNNLLDNYWLLQADLNIKF